MFRIAIITLLCSSIEGLGEDDWSPLARVTETAQNSTNEEPESNESLP